MPRLLHALLNLFGGEPSRAVTSTIDTTTTSNDEERTATPISVALALTSIAFLSNVAYGLTSFGSALVFQAGFHTLQLLGIIDGTDGVVEGTRDIALFMFISRGAQAFYLRKHINRRVVWLMCSTMLPSVLVGTLLSFTLVCNSTLELVLGCVLLAVVALKLKRGVGRIPPPLVPQLQCVSDPQGSGKLYQQHVQQRHWSIQRCKYIRLPTVKDWPAPNHEPVNAHPEHAHLYRLQIGYIMIAGVASGLLTGLVGIPGPPMMLLLTLGVSFDPKVWRATSALSNFATNVLQLSAFLWRASVLASSIEPINDITASPANMGRDYYLVDGDARFSWLRASEHKCGGTLAKDSGLHETNGEYSYEHVLMVIGALLGLTLGNRMADSPTFASGEALQKGIMFFLILGGVSMLTSQLLTSPAIQLAVSFFTAAVSLVGLAFLGQYCDSKEENAESVEIEDATVGLKDNAHASAIAAAAGGGEGAVFFHK